MKREHVMTIVLALFAIWIASVGADSPKFGDIPNPAGMSYGWDAANNTVRALAVDVDGNLQAEAANASTTPANVILRDGTSGAQIGTTTKPLTITGAVTTDVTIPVASATANPTAPVAVALSASNNATLQRLLTAIAVSDNSDGDKVLPSVPYLYDGSAFYRERVKYDRVQSTANGKADITSSTVVLLSTLTDVVTGAPIVITPPCSVQLSCPAGELWYAPGLATSTAASMKIHVLEEKQSVIIKIATSTYDVSLLATEDTSSCSASVHSLVQ